MPRLGSLGSGGAKGFGFTKASSSPPAPPGAIGSAYQGGYYAGEISTAGNGVADYYLVVAPKASGQSSNIQVRVNGVDDPGTSSGINGPVNSALMNDTSHPAPYFCEGLTIGGYSDWYMPARYELEICYYNLKPTTTSNSTSYGTNAYAVPARGSNYTAGTPARTSATVFQSGGSEAFVITASFWSSTSASTSNFWSEYFDYGGQFNFDKTQTQLSVRAVRRVPKA